MSTMTPIPAEDRAAYLDAIAEARRYFAEHDMVVTDEMFLADFHRAIWSASVKPRIADLAEAHSMLANANSRVTEMQEKLRQANALLSSALNIPMPAPNSQDWEKVGATWELPSQAVVSEAVAHAADKAVLEAADRLAELTNHWPHIDDDTEEQGYNDWNTALEALQEVVKERKAVSAGPGLSGTGPLATPTESSVEESNVESESTADGPEQTDDTTEKITVSERWACGCWIDYAAQKEFMCDQHKRHCLYETGCSNITEYGTVFCDRHQASSVSAQAEAGGNG